MDLLHIQIQIITVKDCLVKCIYDFVNKMSKMCDFITSQVPEWHLQILKIQFILDKVKPFGISA